METEIRQILEKLEVYSSQKAGSLVKTSRLVNFTGWGAIISTGALFGAMYFKNITYVTIIGLVFLAFNLLFIISNIVDIWIIQRKPLNGYAKAAIDRLNTRKNLISTLSTFSKSAKLETIALMERDARRMRGKISLIVGAFDKVGLIPAVLALYFSASKLLPTISSSQNGADSHQLLGTGDISSSAMLLAGIIGLYLGVLWASNAINALETSIQCVKDSITQPPRSTNRFRQKSHLVRLIK